jgi:predicted hydrocarbon binding protein
MPFSVKLDDFFKLDYKTGAIYNQLTEKRAQVVPALPWSNLRHEMTKKFGGNGAAFLFETGLIIGSTFGEEFMDNAAEPEVMIRRLCDLTSASGWGTLAMVGDTKYGSQIHVVVANCIFCDGADGSGEPVCDFLTGAMKGITDKIYGTPHKVYESRCIAMKDNICEVVVIEEEERRADRRAADAAESVIRPEEAYPEQVLTKELVAKLSHPHNNKDWDAGMRSPWSSR